MHGTRAGPMMSANATSVARENSFHVLKRNETVVIPATNDAGVGDMA